MDIVVIAKNNTSTDIMIEDLGIIIPGSSQINLTDKFDYIEIVESDNLKEFVNAAQITINDGINDLNIEDGIAQISIQSVYEDSFEDGGGTPDFQSLPCTQISAVTDRALTTDFADIYYENLSIETDNNIIEWDQNNKDRILIKEQGLYRIDTNFAIQTTDTTDYSYFRVRKNDNTVITPDDTFLRTYQNEIQACQLFITTQLNKNDFITIQAKRGTDSNCLLLQSELMVSKVEGIQGPTGPPGGTTVSVQKDDVDIITNCDSINFEGSVAVTDEGNNKVTVTIIDEKYVPKVIQIVDNNGNVNVNTSSETVIQFNNQYYRDTDVFDHSINNNSSRIYVLKNGLYKCSYKLNVFNDTFSRKTIEAYIKVNGTTNIDFSRSFSYSRNSTDSKQTNDCSFYINLSSGDYIELYAKREGSSGTARTIGGETFLTLELKK